MRGLQPYLTSIIICVVALYMKWPTLFVSEKTLGPDEIGQITTTIQNIGALSIVEYDSVVRISDISWVLSKELSSVKNQVRSSLHSVHRNSHHVEEFFYKAQKIMQEMNYAGDDAYQFYTDQLAMRSNIVFQLTQMKRNFITSRVSRFVYTLSYFIDQTNAALEQLHNIKRNFAHIRSEVQQLYHQAGDISQNMRNDAKDARDEGNAMGLATAGMTAGATVLLAGINPLASLLALGTGLFATGSINAHTTKQEQALYRVSSEFDRSMSMLDQCIHDLHGMIKVMANIRSTLQEDSSQLGFLRHGLSYWMNSKVSIAKQDQEEIAFMLDTLVQRFSQNILVKPRARQIK